MVYEGDDRKRILAVGLDKKAFDSMDALLSRARFSVDRVGSGSGGLALCQNAIFDLILISAALPGIDLGEFVAASRKQGSASAHSELLVLARPDDIGAIRRQLPQERSAVLSMDQPRLVLQEMAARLLDAAPRRAARLPVRLKVALASGEEMRFCQTENISAGGMLVRTDPPPPEGTGLTFEVSLPGEREPIRGAGSVARLSVSDLEGVVGVGIAFSEFVGPGREQLETYLDNLGAWT